MFGFTNNLQGKALDAKLRFRRDEECDRSVRTEPGGLQELLWKSLPTKISLKVMTDFFVWRVVSASERVTSAWLVRFYPHTGRWVWGVHFTIMLRNSHQWVPTGAVGMWGPMVLCCVVLVSTHGCGPLNVLPLALVILTMTTTWQAK